MYEKMSNEELITEFEELVDRNASGLTNSRARAKQQAMKEELADRLSSRPKDGWVSGEVDFLDTNEEMKVVQVPYDWPFGAKVEMRLAPPKGEGS